MPTDTINPFGSCIDCNSHSIINDPDPNDWFCDDDKAIVCTNVNNPKRDVNSSHASDRQEYRVVMCAIRPYNLRKESKVPDWCPKCKKDAE